MEIFVSILALLVAYYALVRSRQAHDALNQLQKEISRLMRQQQQASAEQKGAQASTDKPEVAKPMTEPATAQQQ